MASLSLLIIFYFFLFSLFALSSLSSSSSSSSDLFEAWCQQHGKRYSSEEEKQHRLKVFEDNLAYVARHNQLGNSSFTLDLNAFADLTHHEFRASKLGLGLPSFKRINTLPTFNPTPLDAPIPDSIDWRKNGAVTKVKDQASCGACWSFSATGAIEGINKIVTGSLVSLSEQELIDCDRSYNSGCGGGLMDYAYQFVIDNHGIDTEEDYPYQGKQKTCNKDKMKRHVVTIDDFTDVAANNEQALLRAVATQPVSVGICGSEQNGVDYWIVKNSWGSNWGVNGYIHMQRNTGNSQGICGINMLASYPTKTSPNPPTPPRPGPTKCDLFSSCPEGGTCCCMRSVLGLCLRWKCCQLDSAVCCSDHVHCCPHDYPICDTKRNACLKGNGNLTSFKELEKRQESYQTFWNPLLEIVISDDGVSSGRVVFHVSISL
ncbi:hypothetical protein V2J09_007234 [Rumex salicifolius]